MFEAAKAPGFTGVSVLQFILTGSCLTDELFWWTHRNWI
jgi:hypothetical protein